MTGPRVDAAMISREAWRIARIKTLEGFILAIADKLSAAGLLVEAAACHEIAHAPEEPADWTGIDGA